MEKIKINGTQMFMLVVLFEMGSAIVVGIAASAKQDAWISIMLGMAAGVLLFFVYYRLYLFYPDLPLTNYVQKITGKWIGRIIGFLYVIYFIYDASRVLRDFSELLTTTIYTSTPQLVLNSLMILIIMYAIKKGFEVIARVAQLYFGFIYLVAITGFLLILMSGILHFENLRPVLENGWKPVLKNFVGQTLVFPFGEMVVFTMLLPYLNEPKKAKLVCIGGIVLSGVNIAITIVFNIAALGVDLFIRAPFPLLSTISKIEVADFIERLDVFFMLYVVIGIFFKITILYFAAVIGVVDIFNLKNKSNIVFPIGLIVLFSSIAIATNFTEHIKEGFVFVSIYLAWPLQIIMPVLLMILAIFQNRKKRYMESKQN
jgi:spore germination protein KB